jgi:hypothetical protein
MSQSKLFAAFLLVAGMALSCAAEAQTKAANPSRATATQHSLFRPRTPPASHRSPTHHRRAGRIARGTPVHGTMAGPRM